MKENFIFNAISGIYGLFYKYQIQKYRQAVSYAKPQLDLAQFETALDVGCGTGALCSVISEYGVKTTGIDNAQKMINVAKRKKFGKNITFLHANASLNIPFDDNSFDFVIASYVAHGLVQKDRKKMLLEMQRVAKSYVILHEFSQKRRLLSDIIEWLEGGNYFTFLKTIENELTEIFGEFQTIKITEESVWYVMKL